MPAPPTSSPWDWWLFFGKTELGGQEYEKADTAEAWVRWEVENRRLNSIIEKQRLQTFSWQTPKCHLPVFYRPRLTAVGFPSGEAQCPQKENTHPDAAFTPCPHDKRRPGHLVPVSVSPAVLAHAHRALHRLSRDLLWDTNTERKTPTQAEHM